MTQFSWSSGYAWYLDESTLYLGLCFSGNNVTFNLKIIVGPCDLFSHGPMILSYVLKTIQCMNTMFKIIYGVSVISLVRYDLYFLCPQL